MRARLLIAAIGLSATAAQGAAGLRDHEGVNNGLIVAGIVQKIYRTCPDIEVRKIRGLLYLRSLYTMAKSAGFSEEEIEAYVDDEEEEARLRERADAWLANEGATPGDVESYCAVGRDHIERGTEIGVMLRME